VSDDRAEASTPSICDNLMVVRDRIAAAARATGRAADAVTLVAISKEQPDAAVAAALACGQREFGENRAQALVARTRALATADPAPAWHFVGRLQRNKVRGLAPHVARWHSIDRLELAPELARHAPSIPAFVQVNVAREPQKGGCAPEATAALVEQLREAGVTVDGLMTVPPIDADPRPHFAALRALAEAVGVDELSMGMSGDFESAIAEGATYVRVGSSVFGPRPSGVGLRR
jgi:pyridoxal phosphate enzyme (YggS family)